MLFSLSKSNSKITLAVLACLVLTAGCKSSSTDSGDTEVEGLWKLNSTEGDISYLNITATTVTYYDYMGDEYDEGEDCYEIISNEILEVDGDIYKFADPFDPEKTIDVTVTAAGNQLTVQQPFGSITVTIKFTRYNSNISEFTPECSEESNPAKVKAFVF